MEGFGSSSVLLLLLVGTSNCDHRDRTQHPAVREAKLMVIHPHYRPAEPYTYPGPSPPVKMHPRYPEPYNFMPPLNRPLTQALDPQPMPNWCKNMWEKDECGMKCWMLRKICKNIAQQNIATPFPSVDELRPDSEGSHSMPQYNMMPYAPYMIKPTVAYSKTTLPKTYYAQSGWTYAPIRRAPSYYYHPRFPTPLTNEIGLNPLFTFVNGNEKLKTKPVIEEASNATDVTTTTSRPETTTRQEDVTIKPVRTKGSHPVKVVQIRYPDSDVTTMSPLMYEYDQHGNKGYYGDRIYMSAVMPVSDRQMEISSTYEEIDSSEDLDIFNSP